MALSLYDTLSSQRKPFTTEQAGKAKVYVCGPTVYDYAHLGHVRCYVVYDVLIRHLRESELDVLYVRNITDIDDKILKRAEEQNIAPSELAEKFTAEYHKDMASLGNLEPDVEPKVSETISEICDLITKLIENESAYEVDGDVYFRVKSFADYGKLSHRKLDDMLAGASERVGQADQAQKESPADFALWKSSKTDDSWAWDSPWGKGRPGWHIECSAMSMKFLGESFDLHGGGLDLVFPHHENEIAQSEAVTGKPLCSHWVHNGFVEVDKVKMSKSLGNFFTARQLFERIEPEAIRYAMMTVHYRGPLNLEWDLDDAGNVTGFPQFEEAERRIEYLYKTKRRVDNLPEKRIKEDKIDLPEALLTFRANVTNALDDDLNMPVALAHTADFLKVTNELCDRAMRKKGFISLEARTLIDNGFEALRKRLGILQQDPAEILKRIRNRRAQKAGVTEDWVLEKIAEREQARADKDYEKADAVRDTLKERGVVLFDSPTGTDWEMA